MFDPRRIDKREEWFRRESLGFTKGHTVSGNALKNLIRQYNLMSYAIRPGMTAEQRQQVAAKYFPGDRYAAMVQEAKREAGVTEAELRQKTARGRYVW